FERSDLHALGEAHAALVEEDQSCEGRQALAEAAVVRLFPQDGEIGERAADEEEIQWAFAEDDVGDVDAPAVGVADFGAHATETRTVSHLVARPSASHSTRTPSILTSSEAVSNRTGMPVRIWRMASSACTPMTESCGPVMPASVIAAVPPGCTRASFVWTGVCVPVPAA